jgi:hypothetical protein
LARPYFVFLNPSLLLHATYVPYYCPYTTQTSMTPEGFEPTIPASERPQTHALDSAATGIGGIRSQPCWYQTWWIVAGIQRIQTSVSLITHNLQARVTNRQWISGRCRQKRSKAELI